LEESIEYCGRLLCPHNLFPDSYAILFRKEMRRAGTNVLEDELEEEGELEEQVTANAAALLVAIDIGKTAVSCFQWLSTSALAELTCLLFNQKIGGAITKVHIYKQGEDSEIAEQLRAARGERRDYHVCSVLRATESWEALRRGGCLIRDSHSLPCWTLYTSQVGTGAPGAVLALVITSTLLGGIFVRNILEARAWPLQYYNFIPESYTGQEAWGWVSFNSCVGCDSLGLGTAALAFRHQAGPLCYFGTGMWFQQWTFLPRTTSLVQVNLLRS
jgi:hypothetical protein